MTATDTAAPTFTEPDEYGTPPMIDTPAPAEQPPADTKPRRPTTRAGRAAARAAKQARQATSSEAKPKAAPAPRKASLEKRLTTALCSMGGMVAASSALTGSQALGQDGVLIIEHSANVAAAINRVADENPQVKAALERMLSAGAWSGVVVAVLPVVLGIAGNHGVIPPAFAAMLAGAQPEADAPVAA